MTTACIPSVNVPSSTTGYAQRTINGKRQAEHRAAWEAVNGPVPAGLVLDHMCHDPEVCVGLGPQCPHRRCINPEHLTPVTRGDNARRAYSPERMKTECPSGHPYDETNTKVYRGRRYCRACHSAETRRRRAALRNA